MDKSPLENHIISNAIFYPLLKHLFRKTCLTTPVLVKGASGLSKSTSPSWMCGLSSDSRPRPVFLLSKWALPTFRDQLLPSLRLDWKSRRTRLWRWCRYGRGRGYHHCWWRRWEWWEWWAVVGFFDQVRCQWSTYDFPTKHSQLLLGLSCACLSSFLMSSVLQMAKTMRTSGLRISSGGLISQRSAATIMQPCGN